MNQSSDQDLLREYAQGGSDAAFSELTRRYVDLVYTAALRLVRDSALAEDVSQSVFLALAKNCRNLAKIARLPAWLHQTTHHVAANAVRCEVRRQAQNVSQEIEERPFASALASFATGLVLGMLLNARRG